MTLFPLALSVGIVAAILMPIAAMISLAVPAVFIGWSTFFVAGGKTSTIKNGAAPSLFGLLLGYGSMIALPILGGGSTALALLIGLIAFLMVYAMNYPLLALCPGSFLGCAAYFLILNMGGKSLEQVLLSGIISVGAGYVCGVLSVALPQLLLSKKKEQEKST